MLTRLALPVLLGALTLTATAVAAAPPVGPLPPGPTSGIATERGEWSPSRFPDSRTAGCGG